MKTPNFKSCRNALALYSLHNSLQKCTRISSLEEKRQMFLCKACSAVPCKNVIKCSSNVMKNSRLQ